MGSYAAYQAGIAETRGKIIEQLQTELTSLKARLRELALNVCADSELANEDPDRPDVYYGLCVSSTYINELCSFAGVGNYQQALDIIDSEPQKDEALAP